MQRRLAWIDVAKGIGIFLVVYGHVARGLESAGIYNNERQFLLIDSIIYSFHMPLFFFLSGLFFMDSIRKRGKKLFLASKLDSIIYPYIVWSLIQGSIEAVLSSQTNGDTTFRDVSALLWDPRAQFWFLYVLFACFLITTAFWSRASGKVRLAIIPLSILAYLSVESIPDLWVFSAIAKNLLFFTLGVSLSEYIFKNPETLEKALIPSTILAIASQYYFHFILGKSYSDTGLWTLCIALVCITSICSFSILLKGKAASILAAAGSASMVIYLLHILAGSGIRIILAKIGGVDSLAIHLILGTVAGLLFPYIFEKITRSTKIRYLFSPPKMLSVERGLN